MSRSILFVNIGTPKSADPEDVGVYLKEFLGDPEVIPLPGILRWILVNWLIVPKRKYLSAEAYRKIWTKEGSPLRVYSDSLIEKVNRSLPDDICAHSLMRYGEQSLDLFWSRLQEEEEVLVVPAFPQFAMATSGSVIKKCEELKKRYGFPKKLMFADEFYHQEFFYQAVAQKIAKRQGEFDHLLFSYHGLPMSQIVEGDPRCYRDQCYKTTELISKELQLGENRYSVSFQSRLGRAEWIQPYTIDAIKKLAGEGVKRLAVVCPSFVVDCLETLEEIAIGLKEEFIQAGGQELALVPCLNDDSQWAESLAKHWQGLIESDLA